MKGSSMKTVACLLLGIGVFLSGCHSLTDAMSAGAGIGRLTETHDSFSGATVITVAPAPLYEEGNWKGVPFSLGAKWARNSEYVGLVMSYQSNSSGGAPIYVNFEQFAVNIDGEIRTFKPGGMQLENGGYNDLVKSIFTESQATALIPVDYFRRMMTAPDVRIRIISSRGKANAHFHYNRIPGGQGTAKHYFLPLLNRITE